MESPAAKIAKAIKAAPRVVLATHAEPDGDAVGSVLALAHAVRARGGEAAAWPMDPAPARYGFLPGFDELATGEVPAYREGDVVVALDSADETRLPAGVEAFTRAGALLVNVDHHASNPGFGALDWVEPAAPAAVAQVWSILMEMGYDLPASSALCLYVGLVTDTGNFTYSNTNCWAFDMASDLVGRGVSPVEVERQLYGRYPLSYMKVLGGALAGMRRRDGVVYMAVTREDLARADARMEDTEGLVDFARRVEGARVGVLFREVEDGARVSFRAAEELDVSGLAVAHGGGGHPAAAGCFVAGDFGDVQEAVLAEVERWLSQR